jgi:hypothetical protein
VKTVTSGDKLRNLRLGTKFTLALLVVFLVGIVASSLVLWQALEQRAEQQVAERGLLLIQAMNAVRNYTSTRVNPLLVADLETEAAFIPETVPAFSAREVFDRFRQNAAYANYRYREATWNPTNPVDLADDFEREILARFRSGEITTEISGFREWNGEQVYFSARPLAIGAESCLRCHSTPEAAPASLIATYGSEHGFGWQLGEIVTAQMIYVPAEEVLASARQTMATVMSVIVVVFALVLVVMNYLMRRNVAQPVGHMAALASKIGGDNVREADLDNKALAQISQRGDELGEMANVFVKMARTVVKREQQLKDEVVQLRIEIDQAKKVQQVEAITNSDYFQSLQAKAKMMRQQVSGESAPPGAIRDNQ